MPNVALKTTRVIVPAALVTVAATPLLPPVGAVPTGVLPLFLASFLAVVFFIWLSPALWCAFGRLLDG